MAPFYSKEGESLRPIGKAPFDINLGRDLKVSVIPQASDPEQVKVALIGEGAVLRELDGGIIFPGEEALINRRRVTAKIFGQRPSEDVKKTVLYYRTPRPQRKKR